MTLAHPDEERDLFRPDRSPMIGHSIAKLFPRAAPHGYLSDSQLLRSPRIPRGQLSVGKQYVLAIIGYLVGGGMHSYHESMAVAQKAGMP
jgi:hypothetical protein